LSLSCKYSKETHPLFFTDAKNLKKNKKSAKRTQAPVRAPVYAEEEMPEDAALSEEEAVQEKPVKKSTSGKKKSKDVYTKKSTRDIFETNEEAGLDNVDLSTPLGADEKFQQIQAYLSPEEVRAKEEARYRAERKEMRALQVSERGVFLENE
jgi:AP-3 complex subunit delta-1